VVADTLVARARTLVFVRGLFVVRVVVAFFLAFVFGVFARVRLLILAMRGLC
jgi:hypothetical protein